MRDRQDEWVSERMLHILRVRMNERERERECARARARACVRVCACARARARACVCVCVCVWRYRFVPILYCHNSLFSCYTAQKKSNQMKYCLARRRSLRVRRRPEILVDRGNESFSAVSPARVGHDHRSTANEISINEPTRAPYRFKCSANERIFSGHTFIPYISHCTFFQW